jgi:hypothetical protein
LAGVKNSAAAARFLFLAPELSPNILEGRVFREIAGFDTFCLI